MDVIERLNLALEIAWKKYGLLYRWGAKGPVNYDCSGLVFEALKSVGILGTSGPLDAQGIYEALLAQGWWEDLTKGAIVFFGKSKKEII